MGGGGYLLLVLNPPWTPDHKEAILQRVAKGLLSWDVKATGTDLTSAEKACLSVKVSAGPHNELLIQHSTESLALEVLLNPEVSTLRQCFKNMMVSGTTHKHVIHAGYAFAGSGDWILQDGVYSTSDIEATLHDAEVEQVLRRQKFHTLHVHCAAEGSWAQPPVGVSLNPPDIADSLAGSAHLLGCLDAVLTSPPLTSLLPSSNVVGNIRFRRPTMYVFPGGQGDCALFGVTGFTLLVDGGFARKPCFWEFVRHLDRLDSLLVTRFNQFNSCGLTALAQRKALERVYPQVGHVFCNAVRSPSDEELQKDRDQLVVSVVAQGLEFLQGVREMGLSPQTCQRDARPLTLYHKVGQGTLEMFVLSPGRSTEEDTSVCVLLVWRPAKVTEPVTRILLPGSAPQSVIFDGLSKLGHLALLGNRTVTAETRLGLKRSKVQDKPLRATSVPPRPSLAKRATAKRESPSPSPTPPLPEKVKASAKAQTNRSVESLSRRRDDAKKSTSKSAKKEAKKPGADKTSPKDEKAAEKTTTRVPEKKAEMTPDKEKMVEKLGENETDRIEDKDLSKIIGDKPLKKLPDEIEKIDARGHEEIVAKVEEKVTAKREVKKAPATRPQAKSKGAKDVTNKMAVEGKTIPRKTTEPVKAKSRPVVAPPTRPLVRDSRSKSPSSSASSSPKRAPPKPAAERPVRSVRGGARTAKPAPTEPTKVTEDEKPAVIEKPMAQVKPDKRVEVLTHSGDESSGSKEAVEEKAATEATKEDKPFFEPPSSDESKKDADKQKRPLDEIPIKAVVLGISHAAAQIQEGEEVPPRAPEELVADADMLPEVGETREAVEPADHVISPEPTISASSEGVPSLVDEVIDISLKADSSVARPMVDTDLARVRGLSSGQRTPDSLDTPREAGDGPAPSSRDEILDAMEKHKLVSREQVLEIKRRDSVDSIDGHIAVEEEDAIRPVEGGDVEDREKSKDLDVLGEDIDSKELHTQPPSGDDQKPAETEQHDLKRELTSKEPAVAEVGDAAGTVEKEIQEREDISTLHHEEENKASSADERTEQGIDLGYDVKPADVDQDDRQEVPEPTVDILKPTESRQDELHEKVQVELPTCVEARVTDETVAEEAYCAEEKDRKSQKLPILSDVEEQRGEPMQENLEQKPISIEDNKLPGTIHDKSEEYTGSEVPITTEEEGTEVVPAEQAEVPQEHMVMGNGEQKPAEGPPRDHEKKPEPGISHKEKDTKEHALSEPLTANEERQESHDVSASKGDDIELEMFPGIYKKPAEVDRDDLQRAAEPAAYDLKHTESRQDALHENVEAELPTSAIAKVTDGTVCEKPYRVEEKDRESQEFRMPSDVEEDTGELKTDNLEIGDERPEAIHDRFKKDSRPAVAVPTEKEDTKAIVPADLTEVPQGHVVSGDEAEIPLSYHEKKPQPMIPLEQKDIEGQALPEALSASEEKQRGHVSGEDDRMEQGVCPDYEVKPAEIDQGDLQQVGESAHHELKPTESTQDGIHEKSEVELPSLKAKVTEGTVSEQPYCAEEKDHESRELPMPSDVKDSAGEPIQDSTDLEDKTVETILDKFKEDTKSEVPVTIQKEYTKTVTAEQTEVPQKHILMDDGELKPAEGPLRDHEKKPEPGISSEQKDTEVHALSEPISGSGQRQTGHDASASKADGLEQKIGPGYDMKREEIDRNDLQQVAEAAQVELEPAESRQGELREVGVELPTQAVEEHSIVSDQEPKPSEGQLSDHERKPDPAILLEQKRTEGVVLAEPISASKDLQTVHDVAHPLEEKHEPSGVKISEIDSMRREEPSVTQEKTGESVVTDLEKYSAEQEPEEKLRKNIPTPHGEVPKEIEDQPDHAGVILEAEAGVLRDERGSGTSAFTQQESVDKAVQEHQDDLSSCDEKHKIAEAEHKEPERRLSHGPVLSAEQVAEVASSKDSYPLEEVGIEADGAAISLKEQEKTAESRLEVVKAEPSLEPEASLEERDVKVDSVVEPSTPEKTTPELEGASPLPRGAHEPLDMKKDVIEEIQVTQPVLSPTEQDPDLVASLVPQSVEHEDTESREAGKPERDVELDSRHPDSTARQLGGPEDIEKLTKKTAPSPEVQLEPGIITKDGDKTSTETAIVAHSEIVPTKEPEHPSPIKERKMSVEVAVDPETLIMEDDKGSYKGLESKPEAESEAGELAVSDEHAMQQRTPQLESLRLDHSETTEWKNVEAATVLVRGHEEPGQHILQSPKQVEAPEQGQSVAAAPVPEDILEIAAQEPESLLQDRSGPTSLKDDVAEVTDFSVDQPMSDVDDREKQQRAPEPSSLQPQLPLSRTEPNDDLGKILKVASVETFQERDSSAIGEFERHAEPSGLKKEHDESASDLIPKHEVAAKIHLDESIGTVAQEALDTVCDSKQVELHGPGAYGVDEPESEQGDHDSKTPLGASARREDADDSSVPQLDDGSMKQAMQDTETLKSKIQPDAFEPMQRKQEDISKIPSDAPSGTHEEISEMPGELPHETSEHGTKDDLSPPAVEQIMQVIQETQTELEKQQTFHDLRDESGHASLQDEIKEASLSEQTGQTRVGDDASTGHQEEPLPEAGRMPHFEKFDDFELKLGKAPLPVEDETSGAQAIVKHASDIPEPCRKGDELPKDQAITCAPQKPVVPTFTEGLAEESVPDSFIELQKTAETAEEKKRDQEIEEREKPSALPVTSGQEPSVETFRDVHDHQKISDDLCQPGDPLTDIHEIKPEGFIRTSVTDTAGDVHMICYDDEVQKETLQDHKAEENDEECPEVVPEASPLVSGGGHPDVGRAVGEPVETAMGSREMHGEFVTKTDEQTPKGTDLTSLDDSVKDEIARHSSDAHMMSTPKFKSTESVLPKQAMEEPHEHEQLQSCESSTTLTTLDTQEAPKYQNEFYELPPDDKNARSTLSEVRHVEPGERSQVLEETLAKKDARTLPVAFQEAGDRGAEAAIPDADVSDSKEPKPHRGVDRPSRTDGQDITESRSPTHEEPAQPKFGRHEAPADLLAETVESHDHSAVNVEQQKEPQITYELKTPTLPDDTCSPHIEKLPTGAPDAQHKDADAQKIKRTSKESSDETEGIVTSPGADTGDKTHDAELKEVLETAEQTVKVQEIDTYVPGTEGVELEGIVSSPLQSVTGEAQHLSAESEDEDQCDGVHITELHPERKPTKLPSEPEEELLAYDAKDTELDQKQLDKISGAQQRVTPFADKEAVTQTDERRESVPKVEKPEVLGVIRGLVHMEAEEPHQRIESSEDQTDIKKDQRDDVQASGEDHKFPDSQGVRDQALYSRPKLEEVDVTSELVPDALLKKEAREFDEPIEEEKKSESVYSLGKSSDKETEEFSHVSSGDEETLTHHTTEGGKDFTTEDTERPTDQQEHERGIKPQLEGAKSEGAATTMSKGDEFPIEQGKVAPSESKFDSTDERGAFPHDETHQESEQIVAKAPEPDMPQEETLIFSHDHAELLPQHGTADTPGYPERLEPEALHESEKTQQPIETDHVETLAEPLAEPGGQDRDDSTAPPAAVEKITSVLSGEKEPVGTREQDRLSEDVSIEGAKEKSPSTELPHAKHIEEKCSEICDLPESRGHEDSSLLGFHAESGDLRDVADEGAKIISAKTTAPLKEDSASIVPKQGSQQPDNEFLPEEKSATACEDSEPVTLPSYETPGLGTAPAVDDAANMRITHGEGISTIEEDASCHPADRKLDGFSFGDYGEPEHTTLVPEVDGTIAEDLIAAKASESIPGQANVTTTTTDTTVADVCSAVDQIGAVAPHPTHLVEATVADETKEVTVAGKPEGDVAAASAKYVTTLEKHDQTSDRGPLEPLKDHTLPSIGSNEKVDHGATCEETKPINGSQDSVRPTEFVSCSESSPDRSEPRRTDTKIDDQEPRDDTTYEEMPSPQEITDDSTALANEAATASTDRITDSHIEVDHKSELSYDERIHTEVVREGDLTPSAGSLQGLSTPFLYDEKSEPSQLSKALFDVSEIGDELPEHQKIFGVTTLPDKGSVTVISDFADEEHGAFKDTQQLGESPVHLPSAGEVSEETLLPVGEKEKSDHTLGVKDGDKNILAAQHALSERHDNLKSSVELPELHAQKDQTPPQAREATTDFEPSAEQSAETIFGSKTDVDGRRPSQDTEAISHKPQLELDTITSGTLDVISADSKGNEPVTSQATFAKVIPPEVTDEKRHLRDDLGLKPEAEAQDASGNACLKESLVALDKTPLESRILEAPAQPGEIEVTKEPGKELQTASQLSPCEGISQSLKPQASPDADQARDQTLSTSQSLVSQAKSQTSVVPPKHPEQLYDPLEGHEAQSPGKIDHDDENKKADDLTSEKKSVGQPRTATAEAECPQAQPSLHDSTGAVNEVFEKAELECVSSSAIDSSKTASTDLVEPHTSEKDIAGEDVDMSLKTSRELASSRDDGTKYLSETTETITEDTSPGAAISVHSQKTPVSEESPSSIEQKDAVKPSLLEIGDDKVCTEEIVPDSGVTTGNDFTSPTEVLKRGSLVGTLDVFSKELDKTMVLQSPSQDEEARFILESLKTQLLYDEKPGASDVVLMEDIPPADSSKEVTDKHLTHRTHAEALQSQCVPQTDVLTDILDQITKSESGDLQGIATKTQMSHDLEEGSSSVEEKSVPDYKPLAVFLGSQAQDGLSSSEEKPLKGVPHDEESGAMQERPSDGVRAEHDYTASSSEHVERPHAAGEDASLSACADDTLDDLSTASLKTRDGLEAAKEYPSRDVADGDKSKEQCPPCGVTTEKDPPVADRCAKQETTLTKLHESPSTLKHGQADKHAHQGTFSLQQSKGTDTLGGETENKTEEPIERSIQDEPKEKEHISPESRVSSATDTSVLSHESKDIKTVTGEEKYDTTPRYTSSELVKDSESEKDSVGDACYPPELQEIEILGETHSLTASDERDSPKISSSPTLHEHTSVELKTPWGHHADSTGSREVPSLEITDQPVKDPRAMCPTSLDTPELALVQQRMSVEYESSITSVSEFEFPVDGKVSKVLVPESSSPGGPKPAESAKSPSRPSSPESPPQSPIKRLAAEHPRASKRARTTSDSKHVISTQGSSEADISSEDEDSGNKRLFRSHEDVAKCAVDTSKKITPDESSPQTDGRPPTTQSDQLHDGAKPLLLTTSVLDTEVASVCAGDPGPTTLGTSRDGELMHEYAMHLETSRNDRFSLDSTCSVTSEERSYAELEKPCQRDYSRDSFSSTTREYPQDSSRSGSLYSDSTIEPMPVISQREGEQKAVHHTDFTCYSGTQATHKPSLASETTKVGEAGTPSAITEGTDGETRRHSAESESEFEKKEHQKHEFQEQEPTSQMVQGHGIASGLFAALKTELCVIDSPCIDTVLDHTGKEVFPCTDSTSSVTSFDPPVFHDKLAADIIKSELDQQDNALRGSKYANSADQAIDQQPGSKADDSASLSNPVLTETSEKTHLAFGAEPLPKQEQSGAEFRASQDASSSKVLRFQLNEGSPNTLPGEPVACADAVTPTFDSDGRSKEMFEIAVRMEQLNEAEFLESVVTDEEEDSLRASGQPSTTSGTSSRLDNTKNAIQPSEHRDATEDDVTLATALSSGLPTGLVCLAQSSSDISKDVSRLLKCTESLEMVEAQESPHVAQKDEPAAVAAGLASGLPVELVCVVKSESLCSEIKRAEEEAIHHVIEKKSTYAEEDHTGAVQEYLERRLSESEYLGGKHSHAVDPSEKVPTSSEAMSSPLERPERTFDDIHQNGATRSPSSVGLVAGLAAGLATELVCMPQSAEELCIDAPDTVWPSTKASHTEPIPPEMTTSVYEQLSPLHAGEKQSFGADTTGTSREGGVTSSLPRHPGQIPVQREVITTVTSRRVVYQNDGPPDTWASSTFSEVPHRDADDGSGRTTVTHVYRTYTSGESDDKEAQFPPFGSTSSCRGEGGITFGPLSSSAIQHPPEYEGSHGEGDQGAGTRSRENIYSVGADHEDSDTFIHCLDGAGTSEHEGSSIHRIAMDEVARITEMAAAAVSQSPNGWTVVHRSGDSSAQRPLELSRPSELLDRGNGNVMRITETRQMVYQPGTSAEFLVLQGHSADETCLPPEGSDPKTILEFMAAQTKQAAKEMLEEQPLYEEDEEAALEQSSLSDASPLVEEPVFAKTLQPDYPELVELSGGNTPSEPPSPRSAVLDPRVTHNGEPGAMTSVQRMMVIEETDAPSSPGKSQARRVVSYVEEPTTVVREEWVLEGVPGEAPHVISQSSMFQREIVTREESTSSHAPDQPASLLRRLEEQTESADDQQSSPKASGVTHASVDGAGSVLAAQAATPPHPDAVGQVHAVTGSQASGGRNGAPAPFDVRDWGKPLGLPVPPEPSSRASHDKSSSKTGKKAAATPCGAGDVVYVDLTYVPHHGDPGYCDAEFFSRVRARYYVLSGTNPSQQVLDALLEAKRGWGEPDAPVTVIPTYETDALCFWIAHNQKALEEHHIDVAPSASRCTINLQDHESSCAAYRLEF